MIGFTDFAVQAAWKGTAILVAGFAAARLLARGSAALRHYTWSLVFGALLALPAAIALAPKWSVPVPAGATTPDVGTNVTVIGKAPRGVPAPAPTRPGSNPLAWIYLAGTAAVAARFAGGALRARRLLADSAVVTRRGMPRTVRVVESPSAPVPMVWGVLRPVIALPVASRHWSAERMRAVLLHELIHVQRRDLVAQVMAQAACCLWWFHPLAWLAAKEQRRERERAVDDAVLERGIGAAEYAGHLVDLVRGLTVEAPAMADAGDFEGRVRALLDRTRNRAPLGRRMALAAPLAAALVLWAVAGVTSHAQAQAGAGALVGIVTDPSGARVPGTEVRAKNLDAGNEELTRAGAAGEYAFRAIPAGHYELEFRSRGFKVAKVAAVVEAGKLASAPAHLELGETSETVTVVGSKGPAQARAAAPGMGPAPGAQRIPVGGNVQPMKLLRQTRPEYPEALQQQGITGRVIIRAVVGTDGSVLNPKVVNTEVNPALAQLALDAVKKWLYSPSLLNGQPVETATTITIGFELEK